MHYSDTQTEEVDCKKMASADPLLFLGFLPAEDSNPTWNTNLSNFERPTQPRPLIDHVI